MSWSFGTVKYSFQEAETDSNQQDLNKLAIYGKYKAKGEAHILPPSSHIYPNYSLRQACSFLQHLKYKEKEKSKAVRMSKIMPDGNRFSRYYSPYLAT